MPMTSADPYTEMIARLVDQAPPLTPEQRERLALIIRGTRQSKPSRATFHAGS
jgi:hypothetical protein